MSARPASEPVRYERDVEAELRRLVRPFVLTGGRTRSKVELRIESMVVARGDASGALGGERRALVEACRQPRSLGEVVLDVDQPFGVVAVLAGDLVADGHLELHSGHIERVDVALLERVLAGVQAL